MCINRIGDHGLIARPVDNPSRPYVLPANVIDLMPRIASRQACAAIAAKAVECWMEARGFGADTTFCATPGALRLLARLQRGKF